MDANGSFSVDWEETGSILKTRLAGFFTLDTVAAFEKLLWQRISERGREAFDTITDMTDRPTQSTEVHDAMIRIAHEAGQRGSRRAAAVMGQSVLSALQIRRAVAATNVSGATFRTETDALSWLRS